MLKKISPNYLQSFYSYHRCKRRALEKKKSRKHRGTLSAWYTSHLFSATRKKKSNNHSKRASWIWGSQVKTRWPGPHGIRSLCRRFFPLETRNAKRVTYSHRKHFSREALFCPLSFEYRSRLAYIFGIAQSMSGWHFFLRFFFFTQVWDVVLWYLIVSRALSFFFPLFV